mmetsp:Transcript_20807/g.45844  ORF Transcript_20807/g.45844 Transcript_20807/m.45844 type:complete len:208 (+) Transcript_20807:148-771(+)
MLQERRDLQSPTQILKTASGLLSSFLATKLSRMWASCPSRTGVTSDLIKPSGVLCQQGSSGKLKTGLDHVIRDASCNRKLWRLEGDLPALKKPGEADRLQSRSFLSLTPGQFVQLLSALCVPWAKNWAEHGTGREDHIHIIQLAQVILLLPLSSTAMQTMQEPPQLWALAADYVQGSAGELRLTTAALERDVVGGHDPIVIKGALML